MLPSVLACLGPLGEGDRKLQGGAGRTYSIRSVHPLGAAGCKRNAPGARPSLSTNGGAAGNGRVMLIVDEQVDVLGLSVTVHG